MTLISGSANKVYDGSPLVNAEVTVSGEGFVSGQGATHRVTGSQTEVGSSENSFTYVLTDGTLADNYEISVVPGKLTVTAAPACASTGKPASMKTTVPKTADETASVAAVAAPGLLATLLGAVGLSLPRLRRRNEG